MSISIFLTTAQRERLQTFPHTIEREDLAAYFTLTAADLEVTHVQGRGARDRLGFALTLAALRYLGFVPENISDAPQDAVVFMASQVGAVPDLGGYGVRAHTRRQHTRLAMQHLDLRRPTDEDIDQLVVWMQRHAVAHPRAVALLNTAADRLRFLRLTRPGVTIMEKLVMRARSGADDWVFDALRPTIEPRMTELDDVLAADDSLDGTRMGWLRERPRSNSPRDIQLMLDKHAWLVDAGVADWNLSAVHPNRLRYMAQVGRTARAQMLRRMPDRRRYPVVLACLQQSLLDITDELMDMFDQCLVETRGRARRAMNEHLKRFRAANDEIVASFLKTARVHLDDAVRDDEVRRQVFERLPRADMERLVEVCEGPGRALDTEGLDFLRTRYGYIRQFSARFLEQMDVQGQGEPEVLDAIKAIRDANEASSKKLPADSPVSFVPRRWLPYVVTDDGLHRGYYELCALWRLRGSLRSGDAWVANSRRYAPVESYVLTAAEWDEAREETLSLLGTPRQAKEAVAAKVASLQSLSERVSAAIKSGEVSCANGSLSTPRLEAQLQPPSLKLLESLVTQRMPRVELCELLVEVNQWTGFTDHLVHDGNGSLPSETTQPRLHAAILAQACNVGFTRMGWSTNTTFNELQWASSWHLRPETLKSAFSAVADFQHQQPVCQLWGGDGLSSSDGQRFPVAGQSRSARALPRYFGYGRGVTFYTWTSDEFSQYGVKVIPATARDATYILDEILDNETELDVLEHTADTHGYTDLIFALFDLLGYRFAPRLRDIGRTRLHVLRGVQLPDGVEPTGRIDTRRIDQQWDEMLRVAGTMKLGLVTASLLVGKLQAQGSNGSLVQALLEYGRICKTEHVLRYLADEDFRRRLGTQLNRGEGIHALRRFLVFGNLAELRAKDAGALVNQASCLNLLSNAVIVWNTVYLARALEALREEGVEVRDEDVARLSPTRFGHIKLHGRYRFDEVPPPGAFRPLHEAAA